MEEVRIEPDAANTADMPGEFLRAMEVNTVTLSQLIGEVRDLREHLSSGHQTGNAGSCDAADPGADAEIQESLALIERRCDELDEREQALDQREHLLEAAATGDSPHLEAQNAKMAQRIEQLQSDLQSMQAELDETQEQNRDLASRVANSNIRESVGGGDASDTDVLSWEERKQLILRQMEEESFDAESFVAGLSEDAKPTDDGQQDLDPVRYVEQLHKDLSHRTAEIERRNAEIEELHRTLEQQSASRDGGVTIGAAGIAQMLDSDDLVREEREKLQRLQEEWEEKFRQAEVAASLERAKLSRERQEVAQQQQELQEQLDNVRRISRDLEAEGKTVSRRWLAELGIRDSES